jgi:uncharacterized protein (DUF169 family)
VTDWHQLSTDLTAALNLGTPPIAITFDDDVPADVERFDAPRPAPTDDGRTGRVPAGCAFWTHAVDRTFSTVAEDHANCSVGSVTHGFLSLDEAAGRADVATLLETGWVTADAMAQVPAVRTKPGAVTYGPLQDTPVDPDVVLLRVHGKQLMVLHDALPSLRIEGKPQCHIVAVAKEEGEPAASVGCALSRVRTGMPATEMTCAIPADQLPAVVDAVTATARLDTGVARYAAEDARRFG